LLKYLRDKELVPNGLDSLQKSVVRKAVSNEVGLYVRTFNHIQRSYSGKKDYIDRFKSSLWGFDSEYVNSYSKRKRPFVLNKCFYFCPPSVPFMLNNLERVNERNKDALLWGLRNDCSTTYFVDLFLNEEADFSMMKFNRKGLRVRDGNNNLFLFWDKERDSFYYENNINLSGSDYSLRIDLFPFYELLNKGELGIHYELMNKNSNEPLLYNEFLLNSVDGKSCLREFPVAEKKGSLFDASDIVKMFDINKVEIVYKNINEIMSDLEACFFNGLNDLITTNNISDLVMERVRKDLFLD